MLRWLYDPDRENGWEAKRVYSRAHSLQVGRMFSYEKASTQASNPPLRATQSKCVSCNNLLRDALLRAQEWQSLVWLQVIRRLKVRPVHALRRKKKTALFSLVQRTYPCA